MATSNCHVTKSLLSFIAKYGVPTNQWTWLYEALLEVSMTKIALWIRVYVDDWTSESVVKASNEYNNIISEKVPRRARGVGKYRVMGETV